MTLRKAKKSEVDKIWAIMQFAIALRKNDGSNQWQDGYPNKETIQTDIANGLGYIMTIDEEIMIYAALQTLPEPTYTKIKGAWLSNLPYLTIHRIAVSPKAKGKGIAKLLMKEVENYAQQLHIKSIRIDTHHDNHAMLHILKTLGYFHCGQILVRNEPREAFEKLL